MKRNDFLEELLMGLILTLSLILLFMSGGCKSIETTLSDNSHINRKDSTNKEIIVKTDTIYQTIYVQVKDSSSNEKQSSTEIVFGNGGGTWNATTGEATNVSSVKTNESEKNLRLQLSSLEKELFELHNILQSKTDSIAQLKQQNNIKHTHTEKPKSNWYWWLVVGFVLGVGVVIALKKIPATSWLMTWL